MESWTVKRKAIGRFEVEISVHLDPYFIWNGDDETVQEKLDCGEYVAFDTCVAVKLVTHG